MILKPICSIPESRDLELEEWIYVEIPPRECSKFLANIQGPGEPSFPLPDHLKRVRKPPADAEIHSAPVVQVLLCRAADPVDEHLSFWNQFPVDRRKRVHVPRHRPYSAAQCDVWRQHWPCNYRPFVPSSPPLTVSEERATRQSLHRLHLLAVQAQSCGRPYAAAMLVSPADNVQLASSFDWSDQWTLDHPVMVLARHWGQIQQQLHQSRIGTITAAAAAAETTTSTPAPRRQTMPDVYLFTHLDVYLTDEPCLMCAMALLHSRVRRVVCLRENPTAGALTGSIRLHCQPGLNHKYQVYCVTANAGADADDTDDDNGPLTTTAMKKSACCYC